MRRVLVAALVLLLAASCSGGGDGGPSAGPAPRFPDDEGVVTNVNFERIELDGSRRYPISATISSFSTYNSKVISLLSWKDAYVHLGLDGKDTAVWVAGIGVVDTSADPPVVVYTSGLLKRVDAKRRAIFEDGTVLRLGSGVEAPRPGTRVTATIDAARHLVIKFTRA